MHQLTAVDNSFLLMENDRTYGHVNGLITLDPSTAPEPLTADTVRRHIGERIHLLPALRKRLVEVPLGVDLPYWAEVAEVDLSYHVKAAALPSPGTAVQLAQLVAHIAAKRLDRTRPLWEIYVIEGLEDGQVAIMTKLHHAAVDGKAGMKIMTTLVDLEPTGREIPPPEGPLTDEATPSPLEMWGKGWANVARHPERAATLMAQAAKEWQQTVSKLWGLPTTVRSSAESLSAPPKTSFNKTLTPHRNFAYGSVPLATVKEIKNAAGCTINDVVMTLCAGALRSWLIAHDELSDRPLVAMVPVSIRGEETSEDMGNQVSGLLCPLPTHEPEPAVRLAAVHEAMKAAKTQHDAMPAALLQEFGRFTAPAAAEFVARTASSLRFADFVQMPFNLCISNVPGPRERLYYAGAEMTGNYPVSMITDGMGLNITIQSYRDNLDFGLVSTPELIPDLWELLAMLQKSAHELHQAVVAAGD